MHDFINKFNMRTKYFHVHVFIYKTIYSGISVMLVTLLVNIFNRNMELWLHFRKWCLLVCSLFTTGFREVAFLLKWPPHTSVPLNIYIRCVRSTLSITCITTTSIINTISFSRTWRGHSSSMGHLPCDSTICTHNTSVQTSKAGLKRVDGQVPAVDTVGAVIGWDLHVVKQPMHYVSVTRGAVQVHCVADIRFLICTGMRQKHYQRRRLPVYSKERKIFQFSHQIQTITTQCTNMMVKNSVVAQPNTQATRIPRSFCTYKHKR